jgi:hypothetical protein
MGCGGGGGPGPTTPTDDTQPQTGFLSVQTMPASTISIDGEQVGMTPIVGHELPIGEHTVTAENPDHNIRQDFSVTIEPGETTALVKSLEASDASDCVLPEEVVTPSFAELVEGKMGKLSAQTKPCSLIRVNGQLIGKTPLVNFDIQAGEYEVIAENPQHNYEFQYTVIIEAGKKTTLVDTLEPGEHPKKTIRPAAD